MILQVTRGNGHLLLFKGDREKGGSGEGGGGRRRRVVGGGEEEEVIAASEIGRASCRERV